MHGLIFSSLPLQRFFLISAESLARSKVFGVGSVCKHLGQNKFIPRPHLGGHASCIRASLTPTFPPLWGLEVGAHSLICMLSFSAAAGGSYNMGVSLQKKRIRLSEPKDAKRFTAHQASLIVIFFCSLPPNSLRHEHWDRGVSVLRPLVSNALGSFASSVLINSKFQIPNSTLIINSTCACLDLLRNA